MNRKPIFLDLLKILTSIMLENDNYGKGSSIFQLLSLFHGDLFTLV